MDNVLITGGTGFVGHWMRQTEPHNLSCDYISRKGYSESRWFDWKYEYFVHLAPIAPTLVGKNARKYHARLLYCSSGIVYHPENDTEYRRNKMRWEQEYLDSDIDIVIARLFTFYGERLSPDHAIVEFEQTAKAGKPIRIWGDGNCIRSYMYGAELGRWLWAILLHGESGQAYDVGSDTPVTMLELAKRYSDNIIIENSRPDPMPVYLPPDTAKTKALLSL